MVNLVKCLFCGDMHEICSKILERHMRKYYTNRQSNQSMGKKEVKIDSNTVLKL